MTTTQSNQTIPTQPETKHEYTKEELALYKLLYQDLNQAEESIEFIAAFGKIFRLRTDPSLKERPCEICATIGTLEDNTSQIISWYIFACVNTSLPKYIKNFFLETLELLKKIHGEKLKSAYSAFIYYFPRIDQRHYNRFLEIFPVYDELKQATLQTSKQSLKLSIDNFEKLIEQLVDLDREDLAFQIVVADKKLYHSFIKKLLSKQKKRLASLCVRWFKLDHKDFPSMLTQLTHSMIAWMVHKEKPWQFIEDHFKKEPEFLEFYTRMKQVSTEVKRDIPDKLKNLAKKPMSKNKKDIMKPAYQSKLDILDKFKPTEEILELSNSGTYLSFKDFGEDIEKEFVDNVKGDAWEKAVACLENPKAIGFDCEWRPQRTIFDEKPLQLLQIATKTSVFIFDIPQLKDKPAFHKLLRDLFSSKEVLKVCHTADGDIDILNKALVGCQPIELKNCIEVGKIYRDRYKNPKYGLKDICQTIFGKPLSKFEQCSNWSHRPLRQAQLHYAYMDAFVLIYIHERLEELKSQQSELFRDKTLDEDELSNYIPDEWDPEEFEFN